MLTALIIIIAIYLAIGFLAGVVTFVIDYARDYSYTPRETFRGLAEWTYAWPRAVANVIRYGW